MIALCLASQIVTEMSQIKSSESFVRVGDANSLEELNTREQPSVVSLKLHVLMIVALHIERSVPSESRRRAYLIRRTMPILVRHIRVHSTEHMCFSTLDTILAE